MLSLHKDLTTITCKIINFFFLFVIQDDKKKIPNYLTRKLLKLLIIGAIEKRSFTNIKRINLPPSTSSYFSFVNLFITSRGYTAY